MIEILSIGFTCLSIGCALFLILGIFRFLFRKSYAKNLVEKLPAANRERLIRVDKSIVLSLKIVLWLSPVYLILLPISCFFFFPDLFMVATVCMSLFFAVVLSELLMRRWLLSQLEAS